MLQLSLNGVRLMLRRGTEMAMELVSPLLADGIEDSHSMPVELPTKGNEIALGHVHELPLASRELELHGMRCGYAGLPLHEGTFTVLGSDQDTVRGTLSAEAFVTMLGETTLRELLAELAIDMVAESGTIAAHVVAMNALAGKPPSAADTNWSHYFPLYFNPSLYGSENPHWFPDASEWDNSATYDVDDLVSFIENEPVRRAWRWQCLVATSAGQSPTTHPDKWKRTAYGFVNVLDPETGEPKSNTTGGNFYALVPWFRLRWLVLRVLEKYGLQARGDAFLEAGPLGAKSQYTLGNNVPLDAEDQDHYFHASQTDDVSFVPGDDHRQFRIPGQDDSTGPNSDADGVWDASTNQFTPPEVGTYRFIVHVEVNFTNAAQMKLMVRKADGTGFPTGFFTTGIVYISPIAANTHVRTVGFTLNIGAPQVGQPIHFAVEGVVGGSVVWPAANVHTYHASRVQGWLTEGDGVNGYRSRIAVADHLPDWTVAEFLDRVADTFNLEVRPNMDTREVSFNQRMEVLRNEGRNTTDQPGRLLGAPELDHGRKTTGVSLTWSIDTGTEPATDNLYRLPDVTFESELDAPGALQQMVVVRSTRKRFVSVYRNGEGMKWEQRGYDIRGAVEGVETNARAIAPEFVPPHMEEVRLDEDTFVVPYTDEEGSSSFFGTKQNDGTAWLSIANRYNRSGDGEAFATANSWGRAYGGTQQEVHLLLHTDADDTTRTLNHWEKYHRAWWHLLVNAEPVTADLLLDPSYLRSTEWMRFQRMQSQLYLVEKIPVTYGEDEGPLVSEGAYLLRLRQSGVALPALPQFVCAGPGYIPITVLSSTEEDVIVAGTTSGFYTLRASDGTVTVYPSGEGGPQPVGTYCMWPSDIEGEPSGEFESLLFQGNYHIDVAGADGHPLSYIAIMGSALTSLTVPDSTYPDLVLEIIGNPLLTTIDASSSDTTVAFDCNDNGLLNVLIAPTNSVTMFDFINCSLGEATISAIILNAEANGQLGGGIYVNGGTNAAVTDSAVLSAVATLISRGWTVDYNT